MEALNMMTTVLGLLLYTAGFIGNFLSFFTFIQKDLRKVSTGLVFLLLNIFSTIHLLSLVVEFFSTVFQFEIVQNSIFRCQFLLWLQNATRTICSFLATTVSFDRFLRSEYPMHSRIWCKTKNVMKLLLIYILVSILLYSFFFHPLNVMDTENHCSFPYDNTFRLIALNIMPPVRFVLICIIPITLMVGCGIRMIFNIRRAKKRIVQQNVKIEAIPIPESMQNARQYENRRQTITLDRMLLLMVLVNIGAYIVTQIPFNIYTLYYAYEGSDDFTSYSLIRAFLLLWSSIYFGIGFYLFCITSTQFRQQFLSNIKNIYTFN